MNKLVSTQYLLLYENKTDLPPPLLLEDFSRTIQLPTHSQLLSYYFTWAAELLMWIIQSISFNKYFGVINMFDALGKLWLMLATFLDAGVKVASSVDAYAGSLEDHANADRAERKLKNNQRMEEIRARANKPVRTEPKETTLEL